MQTQWLEAEEAKLQERIQQYKTEIPNDVSPAKLLALITSASQIIDVLRIDILDVLNYEKLWKETTDFIQQTILPHFKQIVDFKESDVTSLEVYYATQQVTSAVPRLYLMGVTASLVLKDYNKFRSKLRKNSDFAITLEKKKQPNTFKLIRKAKQEILEELNQMCAAIQDPTKHIYMREFIFT